MKYYIIAGGTFSRVAPHLSLAAPAFGSVGTMLRRLLLWHIPVNDEVVLILTRMAQGGEQRTTREHALFGQAGIEDLKSNEDLAKLIDHLVADTDTKSIILPAAICDFEAASPREERLSSATDYYSLVLKPSEKIAQRIRKERKDIFLVLFKNTAGDDAATQYAKGLALLKRSSANLVLANDTVTRLNMVITPEQARYHESTDRPTAIAGLAEMIGLRSRLRFTRSTVVDGDAVPWDSEEVPEALRVVVNHCIARHAYKPFLGSTVGHFAVKGKNGTILTSRRKTDFNQLATTGLVRIEAHGDDEVIAYGAKPSVGGQSQRIVFAEHPDMDCIVHFHCPQRAASHVAVRSQREYECGSHECGENTSKGLRQAVANEQGGILAVMLDKHGPNIVFNQKTDPRAVIEFIEQNFDLEARTDGEINLDAVGYGQS